MPHTLTHTHTHTLCLLLFIKHLKRQTSRLEASTTAGLSDAASLSIITYCITNKYSAFSLEGLAYSLCSLLYLSGYLLHQLLLLLVSRFGCHRL